LGYINGFLSKDELFLYSVAPWLASGLEVLQVQCYLKKWYWNGRPSAARYRTVL